MKSEIIIRLLTISSLAGLLGAVGLRLTFKEVIESVRRCRFGLILAMNFVAVPLLCTAVARVLSIPREFTIAMILLGAAPFAPVVPVFARMARADLSLAAGLTSIYPLISAILTPLVCKLVLGGLVGGEPIQFSFGVVGLTLGATITLPLLLGVGLNQIAPAFARLLLRPMEIASEAAGAVSLGFVTIVEFSSIIHMGGTVMIATAAIFEISLAAGYWLGGTGAASRRVVALGTSNRNIALALLVALQSFPGTPVVSAVVGNGLLLILLGLVHVGYWRLWRDRKLSATDR